VNSNYRMCCVNSAFRDVHKKNEKLLITMSPYEKSILKKDAEKHKNSMSNLLIECWMKWRRNK